MPLHRTLLVAAMALPALAVAAPLELPFRLEDGVPVIQARIDGREARLLIDSGGAAALALRPDWAQPDAAASAAASQDAQGQARLNRGLAVRQLELAGQPIGEPPPAQTWAKARRPAGVDGYLGWGWLRQRRWIIDYAAARLLLPAPEDAWPANCGDKPQRFEMLGSLPFVRLRAGDGSMLALGLDTGASRNVIQPAREPATAGPLAWENQALGAGGFAAVALQVPVLDGFLGQDFFKRYRVCVDPAGQRLWVQPL